MKCPKCHHEVHENDQYCSYCGYYLKGKRIRNVLLLFLIGTLFISTLILPLFYNVGHEIEAQKYMIDDVVKTSHQESQALFSSLQDFKDNIENAETFIEPLKIYGENLEKQYHKAFDMKATFELYTNNDVVIDVTYESKINDNESMLVERTFNRLKDFDNIHTMYVKGQLEKYSQFLNYDKNVVSLFINEKKQAQLVNQMKDREKIFNLKKGKIGHYGLGAYINNESYIIYKQNEHKYKIMIEKIEDGNYDLAK